MFTRLRTTFLLILLAAALVVVYRGRCFFLTCTPASWNEIQRLLLEKTHPVLGPKYLIGTIHAYPSLGTQFTDTGPRDITLRVELTAIQAQLTTKRWSVKHIKFDDRSLSTQWFQDYYSERFSAPSPTTNEAFQKVKLGPREAYKLTWLFARQDLGDDFEPQLATAVLYTDTNVTDTVGIDAVWIVHYQTKHTDLSFWIHPESGKILRRERNVRDAL